MASNTTMSSRSPVSSPPMEVSEWHVAMADIKGDSTRRRDGYCNGTANNFGSWDGSTTHRFSPSSVQVPVCRNNHLYMCTEYYLTSKTKRQSAQSTCFTYQTNTFDGRHNTTIWQTNFICWSTVSETTVSHITCSKDTDVCNVCKLHRETNFKFLLYISTCQNTYIGDGCTKWQNQDSELA